MQQSRFVDPQHLAHMLVVFVPIFINLPAVLAVLRQVLYWSLFLCFSISNNSSHFSSPLIATNIGTQPSSHSESAPGEVSPIVTNRVRLKVPIKLKRKTIAVIGRCENIF